MTLSPSDEERIDLHLDELLCRNEWTPYTHQVISSIELDELASGVRVEASLLDVDLEEVVDEVELLLWDNGFVVESVGAS